MISKQRLAKELRSIEEEINRLRAEIEKSDGASDPGVSLRGKYSHLNGISYKDILDAKRVWSPANPK